MSKEYYTNINYPIKYNTLATDKIMLNIEDSTLSIRFYAKGFDLFSMKYLKRKNNLLINLPENIVHTNRYSIGNYVLSSNIKNQITNQLQQADMLISIAPDTLFFKLDKISSKEVAVNANIDINIKKQYHLYNDPIINPSKIIISGPQNIIDTIKSIKCMAFKTPELDRSKSFTLKLINPEKRNHLTLSSDTANVFIEIEQFTEASLLIPIKLLSEKQDSLTVKIFPEKVSVKYLVALKDFQSINPELFKAAIRINKNSRSQKIELINFPKHIKITSLEPKYAEYILIKK